MVSMKSSHVIAEPDARAEGWYRRDDHPIDEAAGVMSADKAETGQG